MHGQTGSFQLAIPVTKVDKQKRLVRGVATAEVVDVHGQIVDYETAKAVFETWVGNIREMHQPKAVGKRTAVEFNDERREIILESYISKGAPDTWEKVLDGTLSMYSIGGEGVIKQDDEAPKGRIFMKALVETSLVDNGACPVAKFEIVKLVDGVATDTQPADAEEPTAADVVLPVLSTLEKQVALLGESPRGLAVAKAVQAIVTATPADAIAKKSYPTPWMIERTLGAIACLEAILADEWWKLLDLENYDQENDHATDRAQLQVLRSAIELVLAYLVSEFNAQFEDLDAAAAGELAMARRLEGVDVVVKALPTVFGQVDGSGRLWFAKRGARHSKADTQMIQAMHDTAITLGAMCAKEAAAATDPQQPVATEPTVPTAPIETPAEPQKSADSQPPTALVQDPPASPTPEPITADAVQKLVEASVQKALEGQQATVTAQAATIAELTTRVEKLAAEPAPGGPKTRATTEGTPVHKSLGGAADLELLAGLDPASVVAVMTKLAADAKTDDERERITAELIKFQHKSGAGAVMYRSAPEPPAGPPTATT